MSHEIKVCLATDGCLCVLNTILYLVEKIEWCVHVAFIRDTKLINTHGLVDSHTSHAHLAIYLGGYIWAVSSFATECIQIHCLEETQLETIVSPLTSIYVSNGCEDYSTNICIHSKSDLTSEKDICISCEFFLGFKTIYQNMANYGIQSELQLETTKQKNFLSIKLSEFTPMDLNHLSERIHHTGTYYPCSVPSVLS